jgi:hypothetical protein
MPSPSATTGRPFLPRMIHKIGHRLETAGLFKLPLDPSEFVEEAKRKTGLTDFGGMEFIEPLGRLIASCRDEANLNIFGRAAARQELLQLLGNRLFITRERHISPAIAKTPVESPLFILGLPRTGTTFLHSLLAQDPASRAPLTWEVMFPSSQTGSSRRRITRARRNLAIFAKLSPGFEAIHPLDALLPQECIAMMSHAFLSDEFDNMFDVPSYTAWLQEQNLAPAYEWHRRFLQHLQNGVKARWILKAPAHMASLPTLLETYPDARFIHTHRTPMEVIASLASMTSALRSAFTNSPISEPATDGLIRYWSATLERFGRERERYGDARMCDVHLSEIQLDPLLVVRKIYNHFNLDLSEEAQQRMTEFVNENRRKVRASHHYSMEPVSLEASDRSLLAQYCARHGMGL